MEIVRKLLTPDEISNPALRWNEDCDCVQQTPNGGTTWVDVPAADPRTAPGFHLPPLSTDDPRCDAAANMIAYLHKLIDVDLTATTNWSLASALLALILLVFPGGVLIDLLLIIADVILTVGAHAIGEAFTEDVYDGLLCIYYCNLDADGQMTSSGLEAIAAAINTQYPGTVYDVWFVHNRALLENGWNNAGASGSETGDCTDCECAWCWEWDFTIDQQGWGIYGIYGEYVPGEGFRTVSVETAYSLLAIYSEAIAFEYQFVGITVGYNIDPTFDDASIIQYGTTNGVTFPAIWSWTPGATPNPNTYALLATEDVADAFYLNPNGGDNSIVATVKSMLIRGIGVMPTFAFGHEC